ncbi:hypothetical protein L1987_32663 [Smallanthus sonchifolius]|uniref:Uncharacterized protein n=1 Tax=Smallanthus sonchifolius TaxID=185202 RepID=A0ACB9HPI7_9ASTR|nr:hypothetical protein L1987_32663 [Smallanthus sonchifolius]
MPDNEDEESDYVADEINFLDFMMDDMVAGGGGDQVDYDYDMVKCDGYVFCSSKERQTHSRFSMGKIEYNKRSYRQKRLEQCRNNENIPLSGVAVDKFDFITVLYKYVSQALDSPEPLDYHGNLCWYV